MEKGSARRFTDEDFLVASRPAIRPAPVVETPRRPRIYRIAFWLAVATVLSTFWVGICAWVPTSPFDGYLNQLSLISRSQAQDSLMPIRQAVLANWYDALQFSLALMAILVAHELGHYILTLIYRVPSTPPLFIPFPFFSPFGTMGAVIMMQSGAADRKQIFDIGLAGPLAGLIVAVPILVYGITNSEPIRYAPDKALVMGQPLLIQWLAQWLVPEQADSFIKVANTEASPFLMAGWVGLLVTGLNMMPLGQLDGGHVTFGLLGPKSYWVALSALGAAIIYMVLSQVFVFSLMLVLVVMMGLRHPPSSNDERSLGVARQIIGWTSLILPVLCIPASPVSVPGMGPGGF